MMRIRVLWFGRPSRSPFEKQVDDYRRRVSHRWPAEDVALRPDTRNRTADPKAVLSREAASLIDHHPQGWALVTLDEHANGLSSVDLADRLARFEDCRQGLTLVIGSDLGLDHSLLQHADLQLSLGPLTLPHLLARLVLWEQLYRATDILGAGNYHRSAVR